MEGIDREGRLSGLADGCIRHFQRVIGGLGKSVGREIPGKRVPTGKE